MAFPSKLSATSTGLDYNLHMSDCENQWVVLSHEASDKPYTYGFVYIDPEAGFTLQIAGSFTIDAGGKYRAEPNPLASGGSVVSPPWSEAERWVRSLF